MKLDNFYKLAENICYFGYRLTELFKNSEEDKITINLSIAENILQTYDAKIYTVLIEVLEDLLKAYKEEVKNEKV